MRISRIIANKVDRLAKGYVFTYDDLIQEVDNKEAVIKALNRMVQKGKLAKLSKGKYYKPEQTVFGEIGPERYQVVKDLLEENGKVIGYLTGLSIYNQLNLTTQVSNTIQIGKNTVRPAFKRGFYKISFIRQKNTITKENIPLLQLLDCIRYIKKIPDASVEFATKRLLSLINEQQNKELKDMVRLSMKYPPSTRAMLGAILDELNKANGTDALYKSLNPITKYKLNVPGAVLKTAEKWNIE